MQLLTVGIDKPESTHFILGQTHFIKTVEDVHEALVGGGAGNQVRPGLLRGLGQMPGALLGQRLRPGGTGEKNALALGAGHSFVVFLGEGFFPLNVLNALKLVPEVCRIFCATANPAAVVIAQTGQGRGILGVVDSAAPLDVESEADLDWRRGFLRRIGYKL